MSNSVKESEMAITDDGWESGKLGQDEAYAKKAGSRSEKALDDALNLQLISIRLPKDLINDLKIIARLNGIGYQPLIRQLLTKFVISEKKLALMDALEQTKKQEKAQAKEDRALAREEQKRVREKKAA